MLEFSANYRRFSEQVTNRLMRIAKALGAIEGARVLPAVSDQLRASARVGTVHYSNLIEGNQLPVIEAERAARGELEPDSRAKVELVNYVEALELIDRRLDDRSLELASTFLKELHGVTTRGLGRTDDPHFKPHHVGEWRDGAALVVDRATGQVMHEGPPHDEVGERIDHIFAWARGRLSNGEPPYVVAGAVHYGITDVHPFADGNGRVARLLQVALLMKAGVLPGRMFSFERYYAEDRAGYYDALRSVRRNTLSMEQWLAYFLEGLAEEYERVAAAVADLSTFAPGGGAAPLQLTVSQQSALTDLRIQGRREFSRREYERAGGRGRSAAGRDLRQLVTWGVLDVRGAGSETRYVFAGSKSDSRSSGRPARWTDATIERELRRFVAGRGRWPSQAEFVAAGRRDLYAAASRNGGIRRWRALIGR